MNNQLVFSYREQTKKRAARKSRVSHGWDLTAMAVGGLATGLDACISWEALSAAFGGDVMASAIGAIIPVCAIVLVASKGGNRRLRYFAVAVFVIASAASNYIGLDGRLIGGEAPAIVAASQLEAAASRAENQRLQWLSSLEAMEKEKHGILAKLVEETSTGRGNRAAVIEESLIRLEGQIERKRLQGPSATDGADVETRMVSLERARIALPAHQRVFARLPANWQNTARTGLALVLAILIAAAGPLVLACSSRKKD